MTGTAKQIEALKITSEIEQSSQDCLVIVQIPTMTFAWADHPVCKAHLPTDSTILQPAIDIRNNAVIQTHKRLFLIPIAINNALKPN
jgi:hypothetical protein